MKALLRLQYYLIGGLKTALLFAAIPFLFILIRRADNPEIGLSVGSVVIIAMIIGILPLQILFGESGSQWSEYAKALPYSRRQTVDSKYLFSLLCAAFTAVPAAALSPVMTLLNPAALSESGYSSAAEAALMFAATAAAVVLQEAAIFYPIRFRRDDHLRTFLIFAALLGVILLPYLLHIPIEAAGRPPKAFFQDTHHLPLRMLADAAVCYPFSWLLSRWFFWGKGRDSA